MKEKIIILLLVVFGLNLTAQTDHEGSYHRKMKNGDYYFDLTDYIKALEFYEELHGIDDEDPELNYKLGLCKLKLKAGKHEVYDYFEKAAAADYQKAYYYMALCHHHRMEFDLALKYLHKCEMIHDEKIVKQEDVTRLTSMIIRAKEAITVPVNVEISNLGENFNTAVSEYVPLITADESMMFFTSRRAGGVSDNMDPYKKYFEDVYWCRKEGDIWGKPKNIGAPINTDLHDACVGLSNEGNTLIIFRTNKGLLGGDLYYTNVVGGLWTEPVKFDDHINSWYQEASATLSSDGNTMYFSSNRPGGFGGKDLYRVVKFANGEWSQPQNLGATINSAQDEDAPFLHPDGVRFYYSSNGMNTIGGYDVFSSKLGEDNVFGMPVNLGYPINTVDDDIFFVLSADGKTGYYSSAREGGFGDQDLYAIAFDTGSKHSIVKGTVLGEQNEALHAKIEVIEVGNGTSQGKYMCNGITGKFLLMLVPMVRYKIHVEMDGYEATEKIIEYSVEQSELELTENFVLRKLN